MTAKEFAPIAALIDNCCKDDFDEGREAGYALVLARYPAADVRQAVINMLGRPGTAWVPSTQEIAAEVHAVQYIGTAPWAQERLAALLFSLPDDLASRFWDTAQEGDADLDLIADHVLAIHDTYGKQVWLTLHALKSQMRFMVLLTNTGVWKHGPARTAWDEAGFALQAGAVPVAELRRAEA